MKNVLMERVKKRLLDRDTESGFSLLELVIAIGIVLVLTVGGLIGYGAVQDNAKKAAVSAAASEVLTAAMVKAIDVSANNSEAVDASIEWNETRSKPEVETDSGEFDTTINEVDVTCVFARAEHLQSGHWSYRVGGDPGCDSLSDDGKAGEKPGDNNGGNTAPGNDDADGDDNDSETPGGDDGSNNGDEDDEIVIGAENGEIRGTVNLLNTPKYEDYTIEYDVSYPNNGWHSEYDVEITDNSFDFSIPAEDYSAGNFNENATIELCIYFNYGYPDCMDMEIPVPTVSDNTDVYNFGTIDFTVPSGEVNVNVVLTGLFESEKGYNEIDFIIDGTEARRANHDEWEKSFDVSGSIEDYSNNWSGNALSGATYFTRIYIRVRPMESGGEYEYYIDVETPEPTVSGKHSIYDFGIIEVNENEMKLVKTN